MFHKFSKTAKRLDSNKEHFSSLMASVYGLTTLSSVAVQFFIMGLAGFLQLRDISPLAVLSQSLSLPDK